MHGSERCSQLQFTAALHEHVTSTLLRRPEHPIARAMSPLYWGIGALGLLSVLFEPLREALWELGEAVGGVGGVGGLTNQYGPTPTCNTTEDLIGTNETAPYCFHPGFSGFTPFGEVGRERGHGEPSPTGGVTTFSAAWGVACCLWWFVPLASYLNSPWYRTDAYHAILAVSISSAFPLSWHMAFVAIPASGAPFLAPLLGLSESALKVCHIRSAWASVFWACVHVGGQLFYLLGTSSFVDSFALSPYSDNLLFWFGAAGGREVPCALSGATERYATVMFCGSTIASAAVFFAVFASRAHATSSVATISLADGMTWTIRWAWTRIGSPA